MKKPRVSLNVIVRDEEANLGPCLDSVRGLLDEVVVIDTGSKDRTPEIARSRGATVIDFPWCDDFAAARNAALDQTTGDYVLWLDADDRVDLANRERLADLLSGLTGEDVAYAATCRCAASGPGEPILRLDHIRLFRLRSGVRWSGRVHERILPSLQRIGASVHRTDITIDHLGYSDPVVRRRKLERDLRLLGLEWAERPADPFVRYNLGATLLASGRRGEAVGHLAECVRLYPTGYGMLARAYARLAECHRLLGNSADAWRDCREGLRQFPGDRDLIYLGGVIRLEAGDWTGAAAHFEQLVAGESGEGDPGEFVRAGHNLALAYTKLGRAQAAAELWERVLAREPGYQTAWVGFGELAVDRRDWPAALRAAAVLQELGADLPAAILRARTHLGRRELEMARHELAQGLHRHPSDLRLRLLWSRLCLARGEWAEAEAALLAILQLDPMHAEARRNLAVLRRLSAGGQ